MIEALTATILPSDRKLEIPYVGKQGRVLEILAGTYPLTYPLRITVDFGDIPELPLSIIEVPTSHVAERAAIEDFARQQELKRREELLLAQLDKVIRIVQLPLTAVLRRLDEYVEAETAHQIRLLVQTRTGDLRVLESDKLFARL